MIEIRIAYPNDPMYEKVSSFAKEVYKQRLDSLTAAAPDVFAYATYKSDIIACFGLYCARDKEPLLFETYIPNAFEKISGIPNPDRLLFAELGTRAVNMPKMTSARSIDVSIALTATLIICVHTYGILYLGITTNRTVHMIADALKMRLILLGEPDISCKDEVFQNNWKKFFHVKQYCFGCYIKSVEGCRAALAKLTVRNIYSSVLQI